MICLFELILQSLNFMFKEINNENLINIKIRTIL